MSMSDFLLLYALVLASMLVCRCAPMFLLRGRELPQRATEAIGFIPAAAFTALVVNDVVDPALFAADPFHGWMTIAAGGIVVVVARLTKSLVWCAVAGMAAYYILVMMI